MQQQKPIYVLYNMAEMSRPQIAAALNNVIKSEYFKVLCPTYVRIDYITTTKGLPNDSVILCMSKAEASKFIHNGSQANYRGSVYREPITNHTYIIGYGIGNVKLMFIQRPADDEQEKQIAKTFYATASDIFKAYRFTCDDFNEYEMNQFKYELLDTPERWDVIKQRILDKGSTLEAISFDIETAGYPTFISAFGFTLVFTDHSKKGGRDYESYTIPMGCNEYTWHHHAMRFLCFHPAPKIAHNGTYDCNVLLRYRIPVANMLYDTMLMHHSIRCDALKSLAYCASTLLPDYQYWKGEIKGVENNGKEGKSKTELENESKDHGVPPTAAGRLVYYKYCAKDTYYTAKICVEMLAIFKRTAWAVKNYCLVHFLQYRVGMFMGYAGMPIDCKKFDEFVAKTIETRNKLLSDLRTYADDEMYNPGSVPETQNFLYKHLGLKLPKGIRLKPEPKRKALTKANAKAIKKTLDATTDFNDLLGDLSIFDTDYGSEPKIKPDIDVSRYPTDKKAVSFLMDENPQYATQLQTLLDYRWYSKVISNYLLSTTLLVNSMTDKNIKVLMYKPSICATVTCRYGGGSHDLHCGAYHLNLPKGIWDCIHNPSGYTRYSIDYSHSDDYFVAFYSGCKHMMENVVRTDIDLHMKHAAMVFQRDYDTLMANKKNPDHEAPDLRKLAKSIGHGCKYLMGGHTMYVNMGDPKVVIAGKALGYNMDGMSLDDKIGIAQKLQGLFYASYDGLTQWHKDVYMKLLQNPERTITVGNWTRQILAPYNWFSVRSGGVAQYGQAGTSSNSNAFLLKFFRKPYSTTSYIFAQVHDAMDGFSNDKEDIKNIAKDMEAPITVTDIYGTTRTFSVATETELF